MRFQQVTGRGLFTHCAMCAASIWTDKEPVYADLDGPSFRAYYCGSCKRKREAQPQPMKRYIVWVIDNVTQQRDKVRVNATSREDAFNQAEEENANVMAYDALALPDREEI